MKHILLALPLMLLVMACDNLTKPAEELAGRIIGEKSSMLRFETLKK